MTWENIMTTSQKTNKRLTNLRATQATPVSKHGHRKLTFALITIIALIILGNITGYFGFFKNVASADSVTGIGIGVYWDQACTNKTTLLNWGTIDAGSNNNLTIYVRNDANSAVSLVLNTIKWTPSTTSEYISLNWNYSGQNLKVDEVIPLKLTLTVNSTVIDVTNFSFATIITTTSQP